MIASAKANLEGDLKRRHKKCDPQDKTHTGAHVSFAQLQYATQFSMRGGQAIAVCCVRSAWAKR